MCVFFFVSFATGVGVVGAVGGARVAAAVEDCAPWAEMPTSAGFGDCFEHALRAIRIPRIVNPEIIAIFCWRDQDERVVPE